MRIEFTIAGDLPRKSNSRRLVANRRSGRPQVIKSAKAERYCRDFVRQVPKKICHDLRTPCRLSLNIYYRNKQSDLSDELFADCCELAGIIRNDNYFREKILRWYHDPKHPRVEAVIEELEEYPSEWLPDYQKRRK